MELTYTVLGSDSSQYGPVTLEQLREWIRDGRVVAETQIWRSDGPNWVSASTLPELGIATTAPESPRSAIPTAGSAPAMMTPEVERRIRSGASWFYWIAGFSIVNTVTLLSGSHWGFALGLGVTRFFDYGALNSAGGARMAWLAMDFVAMAVVVLLGYLAGRRQTWAFLIGLILLALDTALTAIFQMWISLALHAFAIFAIFGGFQACRSARA